MREISRETLRNGLSRRVARRVILITDSDLGPADIERRICADAGFELVEAHCATEEQVLSTVSSVAPCGLLVQYAPITSKVINQSIGLRAVARYGAGLDGIDTGAATRAGIAVVNVPDYAIQEVADHTLALALMLVRQMPFWASATRNGSWPAAGTEPFPVRALQAMTLGLAGFGRIARAVAVRARAFGANLIAHDPFLEPGLVQSEGTEWVSWDQLWAGADLVTLHMPLTHETEGVVDARALGRMRPGSYLVDTARAGLVDRHALEAALSAGILAGAAFDVWWDEPPDPNDPLLRDQRVLVTPHVAYLSSDSLPRLRRRATELLLAQFHDIDPSPKDI